MNKSLSFILFTDIFIAGIKQEGILTCTSGSYSLKVPSPLTFSATPHFTITGDGGSTDVILGAMEAGFSQDIPVQVYMSLKNNLAHHLQSKVSKWVDLLSSGCHHGQSKANSGLIDLVLGVSM